MTQPRRPSTAAFWLEKGMYQHDHLSCAQYMLRPHMSWQVQWAETCHYMVDVRHTLVQNVKASLAVLVDRLIHCIVYKGTRGPL